MFDFQQCFVSYCRETGLDIRLSFDMPEGYEEANGTFDLESKTVYINAKHLEEAPDFEKAFYLFHELRHVSQYLQAGQFHDIITRSLHYVIMYDGTCYKLVDGKYRECKLEGGEARFTNLYLGQPHEVDANTYAYRKVKDLFGDSEDLRKLYEFWIPNQPVSDESYHAIYAAIDERVDHQS